MPKKTKKQLNAEFLKKIKTISVGTGSKSGEDSPCGNCGEPLSKHIPALLIPVPIPFPVQNPKPETKRNDETAFAA